MKHTKGEWIFEEGHFNNDTHNLGYGTIIADNWNIAEIIPNVKTGKYIPSEESKANAKLIAAAPDMLEILETTLASLGSEMNLPEDVIFDIRAAIKKATD